MKALTIIQPWASLLAWGEKQYETRHWKPASMVKGELLAIHSGRKFGNEEREFCRQPLFRAALERHGASYITSETLPLGAVLAIAQLVAVWRTEDIVRSLSPQERAFGNYQPKRFAWEVKILHVFETPIPAAGEQSLWEWTLPVPIRTTDSLAGIGKIGKIYYDRATGEVVEYQAWQPPLPATKPIPVAKPAPAQQPQPVQLTLF
jgi:hypothetical protein